MPRYGRNNNRMGSRERGALRRRRAGRAPASNRGGRLTRGNGTPNRGSHPHQYNSSTQVHMERRGINRVNPPSTWDHGPHGATYNPEPHNWPIPNSPDSGSRHTHRFSDEVNQHWGRFTGGSHQSPLTGSNYGYRHSHRKTGTVGTGNRRGGGRKGGY